MTAKTRHIPSGFILTWLDKDNKSHTKSIPVGFNERMTEINAKTKLLLLQLGYMDNNINSPPMLTMGLTRQDAKQVLVKEILDSEQRKR